MKVWIIETWVDIVNEWVIHSVHDSEEKANDQKFSLTRIMPSDMVIVTCHNVE